MKIKKNGVWENFILPVSVPTMTGASSTSDGTKGLVPAPAAGDKDKYLKADGTWGAINVPADNITSGTLPVSRGGTGAATAASALSNLGITYSTTDLTAGSSSLTTGAIYIVYE